MPDVSSLGVLKTPLTSKLRAQPQTQSLRGQPMARVTSTHTYLLHGVESFLRSYNVLSYSTNSPYFMEPEGSTLYSKQLATCPYPEPD